MLEDVDVDGFGEDTDEGPPFAGRASFNGEASDHWTWVVTAQQPWTFRDELCTLTCLQSGDGEILRFELLAKHRYPVYITCTEQQFQSLCEEQPHSSKPARVEASIRQLFLEGLREYPEMARPSTPEPPGDDSSLEAFGEDGDEVPGGSGGVAPVTNPKHKPMSEGLTGAEGEGGDEWIVDSQRSWNLEGEVCTLTCLETSDRRHLQFEILRRNCETITITCTEQQFQEVCEEQRQAQGTSGPASVDAAIRQLFKEGLEECPPSPRAAGQGQRGYQGQGQGKDLLNGRLGSRLKTTLKGWDRCSQGLVASEDIRLLLLRLHPACPLDLLEGWLQAAGCSGAGSCVSVDRLVDGLMQGLT